MEVSLNEILNAREERVKKQKELISEYKCPLICFSMNIAGPKKTSPLINEGFNLGNELIESQLNGENIKILYSEKSVKNTGCTAYFSVLYNSLKLKNLTCEIEDFSPIGRLFDIDVINENGDKISRKDINLNERKCLICDNSAFICSSKREHSVDELQQKTNDILLSALIDKKSDFIAATATKSLLYEVSTTCKPGLVDRINNGSHTDMDIFTFESSISVLFPYFKECARVGIITRNLPPCETLSELRFKGKIAEFQMYSATGGINTHKGAIFSIGILCAACGRLIFKENSPENLLNECALMCKNISNEIIGKTNTVGEKLYEKYGIKGIRGQAENGFPTVLKNGYPVLVSGIEKGYSINRSGCAALLNMIINTEDTNMLNRISIDEYENLKTETKKILLKNDFPEQKELMALDNLFTEKNASPGGCADLLSMCYFLYFYKI